MKPTAILAQTATPPTTPTGDDTSVLDAAIDAVVDVVRTVFPTVESRVLGTLLAVVLLLAVGVVVRRAGRLLKEHYGDAVVETVQAGLMSGVTALVTGFLVVVWGVEPQVAAVLSTLDVTPREVIGGLLTVTVLAAAYSLTRVTKRGINRLADGRSAVSEHQREVAHYLVQLGVYLVTLFLVLALWDVNISGLLVSAGFAGIVLGLAARQTLGAVIAGIVVLFARPFELGDWIRIDDQEGVVTDITIVNTQLRTFDDEVVMIPNDQVTATELLNRSRRGRLRLNVDVGVDYETDVERAMEIAEDAMADVDVLLSQPEPHVVLTEFGDSAVGLRLRFYIANPSARKMWQARTDVIVAVKEAFDEAEVTVPFPQRELSARDDDGELELADGIDTAVTPGDGTAGDGE
ncbi:MAG: mechanosensitive ion channel family protein [Halolamina sp.]